MAKDPAFLFYSQDFYTGVAELTFEERGQYISILCLMHQKGRMKEETIRFLVGSVSVNLKSKFGIDEKGFWYNVRLEKEILARANFTNSRRVNGLMGGRPKASGKPTDNHMENENEDINENEVGISFEGAGNFSFDLKTEISKTALQAAEENQFTHTKKKNTDFIKSQWKVFLSERMNDPPERKSQFKKLTDLTSYFLNWIRNKLPQNGTDRKINGKSIGGKSAGAYELLDSLRQEHDERPG